MSLEHLLAERTHAMGASAIREILKVVSRPGMISLAGGIPAPESFPMDIMGELTERVMAKYGPAAFQYDATEGFAPLREQLVGHLRQQGIAACVDDITIGCGSQGVLDALAKVLITKGDRVAVESPTYLGAIQAFNPYQPEYVSLATDDEGILPGSLEACLASGGIKIVYLVPTFQNPTGRTLGLDRRRQVAELLRRYNALLIEDDPYSALRYRGDAVPAIHTFAPEHVVYVGTFSKILAPGLRVGFCVAPDPIGRWVVLAKQGNDLHTSTFNQAMAAEYLAGGYLKRHLPRIIDLYRPRCTALVGALKAYFSEGFCWSDPDGGMFVWVRGPEGLDMEAVYNRAVARGTAFVPGRYFFADPEEGIETMRLNFTMCDEGRIDRAVKILAEVVSEERLRV
ncbi:MAG: PLP-dependent aminotransferase family protein [Desulfobacterales bacterium]|nr:PLP-dependent aminotransferase family protein [Desulfobacterales bacterium]